MTISQSMLSILAKIMPVQNAHAHCDVPCGIYDPHWAIVGGLTVIRMIDIMQDHARHIQEAGQKGDDDLELRNNLIRAVEVKEEHAEIVKHEVRVIWGDYFKPEHKEKFPELDTIVYEIMQLASKVKQTVDRNMAVKLLDKINRFAEIFWESKGKQTKRVKAPYKPEEEIVIPIL